MHQGRAYTSKRVLTAGWQQILERCDERVALIFSVAGTDTVYLSFSEPHASGLGAGEGHLLDSSHSPLVLADYLMLRLYTGPVYAYTSTAGTKLFITEVIVGGECRERLNYLSVEGT